MRALVVLILGVAAGCGGSDPVWSSSVSQLVMLRYGGFGAPWQPTAECPVQGVEYTLVMADRSLSAWRCENSLTPPHTLVRTTASRTLTNAELDALVLKLEAFRVVSLDTCGADKEAVTTTLTTPSGVIEYGDSFYSCDENDDRPKIESSALDAVGNAFSKLLFPLP